MCPGSVTGARATALVRVFVSAAVLASCQVDDRALSPPDTAASDTNSNGSTSFGSQGSPSGSGGSGPEGLGGSGPGGSGPGGSGGNGNGNVGGSSPLTNAVATANTTGAGSTSNEATTGGNATTATSGGGATSCTSLGESGLADPDVPFAEVAYTFSDQVTTICIESPAPGKVCAYGIGADAHGEREWSNWGAGLGFRLAPEDENGMSLGPFDAQAAGIVGARYRLEFAETSLAVRLGMTLMSTDDVPFEDQPFAHIGDGNGIEGDVFEDTDVVVLFDDMALPDWADFDEDPETIDADVYAFDPTRLHSIQFQVVTQADGPVPFDFCVIDFEWFDADGNAVSPP